MPEIKKTRTIADISAALLTQKQVMTPSIVGWNRLEPRPRTADFERSLKAEVRDALWMLTRQWQMGEFKGDDAGSPIDARILTEENTLNRFMLKGSGATTLENGLPLETRVERESIPDSYQLKIQISTQFWKLLSLQALTTDHSAKIKSQYKITLPTESEKQNRILCNPDSLQIFDQASLKSIDGTKLISDISEGIYETWITSYSDIDISSYDKIKLINAGSNLQKWFKRLYSQPEINNENAWHTAQLEYQFTCAAPESADKQTILTADKYTSGHLDWYAFDIDKTKSLLTDAETIIDTSAQEKLVSFIPTGITFNGMPNGRYWQMEDSKTDFGDIDANTTDISKMIVAEFGLICSNDWFLLPYKMDTGNICSIKGLVVTDTFGDRTLIHAAGKAVDDDWQSWQLYNMSELGTSGDTDNRLILVPALTKTLESDPLEQVNFIKDEVANMVWGVETKIILPGGQPANGIEAARELSAYLAEGFTTVTTNLDAPIKYKLGTSVPENWIPFISVHVSGANRKTQLQRAAMPRVIDGSNELILPRTNLIAGDNPFFIYEEEVPSSGTIVTKTFQRVRWYNGKTILWLGKKVKNGKGQGNSGLSFDQIDSIK